MMGSLDETLLISSPSFIIHPWLDILPCLLRCKSSIHLARWLLNKCLNADLKILVETAFVPSGCEGQVTTFLSFPGDSCVAQSEHSSAGLQLLCMNVNAGGKSHAPKLSFPPSPGPGGAPGLQPEGGCDPAGLARPGQAMLVAVVTPCQALLLPHRGHPTWASPSSTISLF